MRLIAAEARQKRVRILGAGCLAVGALLLVSMLLHQTVGHALLTRMHSQDGAGLWGRVHAHISRMPLSYNLDRADAYVSMFYRSVATGWTLAVWLWLRASGHLRRHRLTGAEWGVLVGVLGWILSPWVLVKCAFLLLALSLGCRLREPAILTAPFVRLAWLVVFAFSYLCAPYGWLPSGLWGRLLALLVLPLLGWWWAWAAAGALKIPRRLGPDMLTLLAMVGLALLALSWRSLTAGLAWKGDEDYHIMQVIHLCETRVPLWLAILALAGVAVARAEVGTPRSMHVVMGTILGVATVCGAGYLHLDGSLVRYPYSLRWLQAFPVQALFPLPSVFYQESLFRLTCVVGVLVTAGVAMAMVPAPHRGLRLTVGLVVATLPTFQFYGSTLCLEMPAVALMTLVCARIGTLLESPPEQLRADIGWLALVLLGFLKETTLPFLLLWVVCRLGLRAWRRPSWTALRQELVLALVVMTPLAIYLFFRSLDQPRGYAGLWAHVFRPDLWETLLGSWFEQFGLLLFAAPAGLGMLARERSRPAAFALLACWAGMSLFYLADSAYYVGYSRFNLMILPPILVGCVILLCRVIAWRPVVAWSLLAIGVLGNVWLSPLKPDGSWSVQWGSPRCDMAEARYPYREVIRWLYRTDPTGRLLFAGCNYPFFLNFYFRSLNWSPAYEQPLTLVSPADAFEHGRTHNVSRIVLHVNADGEPLASGDATYRLERVFATRSNILGVYVSRNMGPAASGAVTR